MQPDSWLTPASLPYQMAFDHCIIEANHTFPSVYLIASNRFYAYEIIRRWPGALNLIPTGNWHQSVDLPQALDPVIASEQVQIVREDNLWASSEPKTIFWAEPTREQAITYLKQLLDALTNDSALIILGRSQRLSRFASSPHSHPVEPASLLLLTKFLQQQKRQWRWKAYGFHGPLGLLAGGIVRLPALIGRDDLVDRLLAFARRHLVSQGRGAHWSPIWILSVRRKLQP